MNLEEFSAALERELNGMLERRTVRLVGLITLDGKDDDVVIERLALACGSVKRPVIAVFETKETT